MMSARQVLIALVIAFGVAATIAAWTTIRQVNTETSSITQPIRGSRASADVPGTQFRCSRTTINDA
jgi:hypothetical protein